MGSSKRYWIVDDVGRYGVVVEDDLGKQTQLARNRFPKVVRPGMVFWQNTKGMMVRDSKEEHRRIVEARAMLKQLQGRDPGGDITT